MTETDKDLKEIVEREWQEARKGFHYPQLPSPKLTNEPDTNGSFTFENLQASIDQQYITSFRGS